MFIPLATGYSPTLTVVVALFGLYRRRIPEAARAAAARLLEPPVNVLKAAHSGVVGDYVMWLTVGTAVSAVSGFDLRSCSVISSHVDRSFPTGPARSARP